MRYPDGPQALAASVCRSTLFNNMATRVKLVHASFQRSFLGITFSYVLHTVNSKQFSRCVSPNTSWSWTKQKEHVEQPNLTLGLPNLTVSELDASHSSLGVTDDEKWATKVMTFGFLMEAGVMTFVTHYTAQWRSHGEARGGFSPQTQILEPRGNCTEPWR